MNLLDFKIGSLLRLDIYDDNNVFIDRDFVSQFEEAIDDYEAYIAVPIVEGVVYAVRVGWSITVYMQEGNNFYRFQARVTQRLQQEGRPLIRILRLSEIDEAQRRKYYRFKCSIPIKYRVITGDRKDLEAQYIDGKTANISGAGLCFTSVEEIRKDSLIECELMIDGTPVYLVGQIMRCARNTEGNLDHFEYQIGVLFSEIEEQKRELIIRFIFYEERRQLQMRIS